MTETLRERLADARARFDAVSEDHPTVEAEEAFTDHCLGDVGFLFDALRLERTEALQQARKVITQYLATAEKWRYDRVVWAFAVMLGEIPEDTPQPAVVEAQQASVTGNDTLREQLIEAPSTAQHQITHSQWGIRNHEGHVGLHANEHSARETYQRQRDHVFPPQALIRRTVTTLYTEWEAVEDE